MLILNNELVRKIYQIIHLSTSCLIVVVNTAKGYSNRPENAINFFQSQTGKKPQRCARSSRWTDLQEKFNPPRWGEGGRAGSAANPLGGKFTRTRSRAYRRVEWSVNTRVGSDSRSVRRETHSRRMRIPGRW